MRLVDYVRKIVHAAVGVRVLDEDARDVSVREVGLIDVHDLHAQAK